MGRILSLQGNDLTSAASRAAADIETIEPYTVAPYVKGVGVAVSGPDAPDMPAHIERQVKSVLQRAYEEGFRRGQELAISRSCVLIASMQMGGAMEIVCPECGYKDTSDMKISGVPLAQPISDLPLHEIVWAD